ncbi:MAG: hypothetical protein IJ088_14215 [Clostridia bacterium]|nr:hypothetical protein [Clostridia bacterium]
MSERKKDSPGSRFTKWLNQDQDVLERQMIAAQTREPDSEVDLEEEWRRQQLLEEQQEEEEVAGRLEALNAKNVPVVGRVVYVLGCFLICVAMIALLLYTVTTLPGFGRENNPTQNEVPRRYIEQGLQETGAVNIVTGMILDYRAFDTLGESTVLFAAVMVVLFLLRLDADSARYSEMAAYIREEPHADTFYEPKHDAILQHTAKILTPISFLLGIYVILNGHLSPGGGFSGGAIVGAGLVLYVTAFGFKRIRRFFTYKTYQRTVVAALLTYAVSKTYSFYTGANGLESGIPLGTPGAILSGGLILLLNICVGLIVACTVYVLYAVFRKGEV